MISASNIHYELGERVHGLGAGGIGAIHLLVRRFGLADAIDGRLRLLKIHQPYYESDHVLNIAYNILANGTCLEDLETYSPDSQSFPEKAKIGPARFALGQSTFGTTAAFETMQGISTLKRRCQFR
jgi:hypothetical protein